MLKMDLKPWKEYKVMQCLKVSQRCEKALHYWKIRKHQTITKNLLQRISMKKFLNFEIREQSKWKSNQNLFLHMEDKP